MSPLHVVDLGGQQVNLVRLRTHGLLHLHLALHDLLQLLNPHHTQHFSLPENLLGIHLNPMIIFS